ncbi:MAG: hypothetical protein EXR77_09470 [Myxococcales bacterium]|nr:hypothetical protein [Myxococcales bacterium]
MPVTFNWIGRVVAVAGPGGETWLALAISTATTVPASEYPPPPAGWAEIYDTGDPMTFDRVREKVFRICNVNKTALCANPAAFAPQVVGHVQACCAMAWSSPAPASAPRRRPSSTAEPKPEDDDTPPTPGPAEDTDAGRRPVTSYVGFGYDSVPVAGPPKFEWGANVSATVLTDARAWSQLTRFELGGVSRGGYSLTFDMLMMRQFGGSTAQFALGAGAGASRFGRTLLTAMDVVARAQLATRVGSGWVMVWVEPVWLKFTEPNRIKGSAIASFADQFRAGGFYTFSRGKDGRWGLGCEVVETGGARFVKVMAGIGTWR